MVGNLDVKVGQVWMARIPEDLPWNKIVVSEIMSIQGPEKWDICITNMVGTQHWYFNTYFHRLFKGPIG